MTTAQIVETSDTVNNNRLIQDYVHPDDQTQPTFEIFVLVNIQVSISKKSSQRVGILMRFRNLVPTQSKLQLYKAAVLPYLTYRHLIRHFCRANALL